MFDLNQLFPASSNLYVISASNINESGQIAGMAVEMAGPHAGTIVHSSGNPGKRRHGENGCRRHRYASENHYARCECWQAAFAEVRTLLDPTLKALSEPAPCITVMLREGATCEVLRDILGRVNIDATQNFHSHCQAIAIGANGVSPATFFYAARHRRRLQFSRQLCQDFREYFFRISLHRNPPAWLVHSAAKTCYAASRSISFFM